MKSRALLCPVFRFIVYLVLSLFALGQAKVDGKQPSPIVQTEFGEIVGKTVSLPFSKLAYEYLGIPYAQPPLGELRFSAPKPAKPWSGTKDASKFGAMCPQPPFPSAEETGKKESAEMSEDCLFVNVYVPSVIKSNDLAAVMVWIHGGAFTWGTGAYYPGDILATFNDVIVVTFNYRLGLLGFFNVPGTDVAGNYGLLDQVLVLKWVQANIASFGGDPNRVTIFGESAGAMSVSLHLLSPMSKGLFKRAIMQSGASSTPFCCGKATNTMQSEMFANAVNCSMGPHLMKCAKGVTLEKILTVQKKIALSIFSETYHIAVPSVDGEFLQDLPENMYKVGKFHEDIDVIAGFNSNEGSIFTVLTPLFDLIKDGMDRKMFESSVKGLFYAHEKIGLIEDLIMFQYTNHADPNDKIALRQAWMEICGHAVFDAPAVLEAKSLTKGGRPPYVYLFDHRALYTLLPDWITGVMHAMEIPFVFGAPFKKSMAEFEDLIADLSPQFSESEKGLSSMVMKLWTNFAKHGSPNSPDSNLTALTWPKFTEEEQAYLVLDLKPRVEHKYKPNKMAFWNEILPKVKEFTRIRKEEADEEKVSRDEL